MDHQALITIAPWTLMIHICNLLLQAWLFKKFLFKPIKNIIDQRKAEIDGLYEEADKAKQTAQEAESTYTQKLLDANKEASAIISQAAQTAREKGDAIVQEAQRRAGAIVNEAIAQADAEADSCTQYLVDVLGSVEQHLGRVLDDVHHNRVEVMHSAGMEPQQKQR